jgi:GTPase
MTKFQINSAEPEKAIIIGATLRGSRPLLSLQESLDELELLADTAGMQVVGRLTQIVNHIDPSTFIGSGKIKEAIELLKETQAKSIIFDEELSPRHQRELSNQFGNEVKLLDRSTLILDIFAQHAKTREGALQVELAQYEYRLPRLTRQWTHLARQGGGGSARGGSGGVGLRGPGETQLEVDKREIRRKIDKLKEEIEHVRRHRSLHRNQRRKTGIPVVALVGYTNAGKSTLINALSDANVYVADQLFATLDPTTRRINLSAGREILLTDTVGFIQKLPTTVIAAFRATLEEIVEASILLHIVDVNDPHVIANVEAVEEILAEIEAIDLPKILVWNKVDLYGDQALPEVDLTGYAGQISISAQEKINLEELLRKIEETASSQLKTVSLLIPFERGDLIPKIFEQAQVKEQTHTEQGVILKAEIPLPVYERYKPFILEDKNVQEN